MPYLRCPECQLTVPALAYYLRGDECPRCMTAMLPYRPPDRSRQDASKPPRSAPAQEQQPTTPA